MHTSHIRHLYNIGQLTWYTAAEFIRKLGDEIVVDTILERSEHDHGTRVLYRQLLHSFVWKHVLFTACNVLIKDHIYTTLWHIPPLPLSSEEDGKLLVISKSHIPSNLWTTHRFVHSTIEKKQQSHPKDIQDPSAVLQPIPQALYDLLLWCHWLIDTFTKQTDAGQYRTQSGARLKGDPFETISNRYQFTQ